MYSFFNLNFKSDLDLSAIGCAKSENKNCDVNINLKKETPTLPNCEYSIGQNYSYFNKKNIALYEVINGCQINIYPKKNFSVPIAAETLLNFPLALCMSQRGYFVLHAATVYKNNICATFAGKSHSGKSTIAYGLKKFGWSIISEDITVIDTKKMLVLPSYPYIKLSDEAKNRFCMQDLEKLQKIKLSRSGYLMKKDAFETHQPQHIFFLNWQNKINVTRISMANALRNLFKFSFVCDSIEDSKKIVKFSGNCSFYSLDRPKNLDSIEQISKILEKI